MSKKPDDDDENPFAGYPPHPASAALPPPNRAPINYVPLTMFMRGVPYPDHPDPFKGEREPAVTAPKRSPIDEDLERFEKAKQKRAARRRLILKIVLYVVLWDVLIVGADVSRMFPHDSIPTLLLEALGIPGWLFMLGWSVYESYRWMERHGDDVRGNR